MNISISLVFILNDNCEDFKIHQSLKNHCWALEVLHVTASVAVSSTLIWDPRYVKAFAF